MQKNTAAKKRKRALLCVFMALMCAFAIWVIRDNKTLVVTQIVYEDADIPPAFDGFVIAQVSDVHDAQIGPDNRYLVSALEKAAPDIIVITGDFVDSNRTDIDRALSFAARAVEIAPVYYANGNHEALLSEEDYRLLTDGLRELGVTVMEDQRVFLRHRQDSICLIGLRDIGFVREGDVQHKIVCMQSALQGFLQDGFNLALSHRPELADAYASAGADLVLCGHAHGGQFRLPFVGGLAAPGQGLFPRYDAGLYRVDDTAMIVSRGIGNSVFPVRFNNPPEIVLIRLKAPEE